MLVAEAAAMFMQVQVARDLPAPPSWAGAAPAAAPATNDTAAAERIEIALPDGKVIRVREAIGAVALRRVMAALRG